MIKDATEKHYYSPKRQYLFLTLSLKMLLISQEPQTLKPSPNLALKKLTNNIITNPNIETLFEP